jgi:hypothetical protein
MSASSKDLGRDKHHLGGYRGNSRLARSYQTGSQVSGIGYSRASIERAGEIGVGVTGLATKSVWTKAERDRALLAVIAQVKRALPPGQDPIEISRNWLNFYISTQQISVA